MRIFLSLLLLLAGFNQILSRSLYSKNYEPFSNVWYNNDDNYPSDITFNNFADDLFAGDSSEELKETLFPSESNENVEVDNFLNSLVSSLFVDAYGNTLNHDQHSDSNENIFSDNGDEKEINNAEGLVETVTSQDSDNDDKLERVAGSFLSTFLLDGLINRPNHDKNTDSNEEISFHEEANKQFPIYLYDISTNMFERVEPKSFEGETRNEVTTKNSDVEVIDITKSSEEDKSGLNGELSEKDIEELTALLITLTALDDVMKISNTGPEYNDDELGADNLKSKEVDEFLKVLSSILDKVLEEELKSTEKEGTLFKNQSDEDDDNNDYSTTPKNDSDELNDYSTTPKTGSDEESDSDENIVFHGIDEQQKNVNDHKYEIIETSQELKPTSTPFGSESASPSSSDDHNVIQEYAEIRKNLNNQQNNLEEHQLTLDKDFYNIVSSNYDEENMNRFERHIFGLHDDLDRIKRNINAMQNIHSKLYFHQLITAAVEDAKKKADGQ